MLSHVFSEAIKGNKPSSCTSNQVRWRLFLFVFVPAWIFYLTLLSPTITEGGDCGELVATSYRLGIGHPSGYAIWCMLGRTFALIPFGEIAWRYNLFSSVCGAISAALLALTTFEILIQPRFSQGDQKQSAFWASLACGFLFAGFYYAASQFIIAEVYSLASLWGSLLIWLAIRWRFGNDWRDAFGLAFCAGLAPLIHLSSIFLLPWLFVFAIWKRRFSPAKIATCFSLFSLALVCICYFPIRSAQFPALPEKQIKSFAFYPLDWNHTAKLSQLKVHVTASQYRHLLIESYETIENGKKVTKKRMAQPISQIPLRLSELFGFMPMQFLWATPLILVGAFKSFKFRGVGWLLTLIFLGNIVTQINYKVPDQTNFFFPAYIAIGIWMGVGWFSVFNFAFHRGGIIAKAAPLLLFTTVFCQWSILALTLGSGGHTIQRDIGITEATTAQRMALSSGKTSSIFFGSDDALWRFWYTKYVLEKAPKVETPWGREHYGNHKKGLWPNDVAMRKQSGPVFMADWDANTDSRFPYVLVEDSGLLWLASDNALPNSATIIHQIAKKTGLINAKIRRAPLWKSQQNGDANLIGGILVAVDVEFALPENWKSGISAKPTAKALLGGEIEFKVGKKGAIQKRRLILPPNWKAGQVLKTTVPLLIGINTKVGRYGLWTRLSNAPYSPTTTDWKESDFLCVNR